MAHIFRNLAHAGIGVLALDLPGCGDSAGDFAEARWHKWLEALNCGSDWLRSHSTVPVSACGLRLGAALALDLTRACGPFDRLILLQPVLSGAEMILQYLRLRVAFSGIRGHTTGRETTHDIRARLAGGESIEVAGYLLAPELVRAIDQVNLATWQPREDIRIEWIQTGSSEDSDLTIAAWRERGAQVHQYNVAVKPYWTHTRANAIQYEPLVETIKRIFV